MNQRKNILLMKETSSIRRLVSTEFLTKKQISKKSPVFLSWYFITHHFNATLQGGAKLSGDFFPLCQSVDYSADIKPVKKEGMRKW